MFDNHVYTNKMTKLILKAAKQKWDKLSFYKL